METPGEIAAKTLAWQVETQSSVDIEVTTTIASTLPRAEVPGSFSSMIDHYIETASGNRFLDSRAMNGGVVVNHYTHFGYQGKFTDLNYADKEAERQVNATITNHFTQEDTSDRKQVPIPLLYLHVGRKPLQEALPKAEYLGTGDCLGRECQVFLFVFCGPQIAQVAARALGCQCPQVWHRVLFASFAV